MVKVYWDFGTCTQFVAEFVDEEIYNICLPALEAEAEKNGCSLIESVED